MDIIQVPNASINQSFERREPNALEYPRPQQTFIIPTTGASPCTADNNKERTKKVEVSLPPYSCRSNEQKACNANSTQMEAGQKCSLGEVALQDEGQGDSVGRKQWT